MKRARVTGLVVLLLSSTVEVRAQDNLLDEPRQLEQVSFSPPTTASIRLSTGVRRTGKIVSISRESMVYQVGRDNREVTVEIDDIQRVNTLDNEFTYEPAKEDFERLKIKARRLSFLRVETVETYVPPPEGFREPDPPGVNRPPVVVTPQPEPRPDTSPDPAVPNPDGAAPPDDPAVEIPDDEPQPGQLILFCSHCQGRLPLSITNGDQCPHCERVLYNLAAGSHLQSGSGPTYASGGDPASAGTAYPEVTGNPAAAGGNGGQAPAGDAAGGGQITAQPFRLSELHPGWHVAFFVGLLVIGWLVLQRR